MRVRRCGRLWIAYRLWVDHSITEKAGRSENFHSFVYTHTLGLPSPQRLKKHWSGSDAADLLACLAEARLLGREGGEAAERALTEYLDESLKVFDGRFLLARNRVVCGLSRAEEGEWTGDYDFIQLADPQLGMLHWDHDWTEELTMLRLAVQHVNRLRPRFLVISGDLINAFPTEDNASVAARQVASFKEALHELNPSIFLVLQPGNHDIGQQPKAADIECYRSRFGDDYFAFWVGGVMYISLNSQYYRDDLQTRSLREQQDVWVRKAFQEVRPHPLPPLTSTSRPLLLFPPSPPPPALSSSSRPLSAPLPPSPTHPAPLAPSPTLSAPLLPSLALS